MKRTQLSAAVLIACLGLNSALAADEVYTKEVEVTATRVAHDLMDVPMSVGVVTADEISKKGVSTIGEVIRDIPGVELENDGTPGLVRVSIRGEGTQRTTILIDGQKISEHKSMSGAPILIDPSAVERVEVIKGPASVLYGSDAIGGVINIITKKGGTRPVQFDISAGYNGSGDGFISNASVYGSINGFKYRLSGSYTDFGDLKTPDKTIHGTNYDTRSGSAFLSYDFTENLTMGFTADHFQGRFRTAEETGAYNDFGVRLDPWKREKAAFFMDARNLSEYLVRLRLDVYVQKTDKDMINIVDMDSAGTNVRVDNHADNTIKSHGLALQSEWQLGDYNYLIAGLGVDTDKLDSYTKSRTTVTVNPMMQIRPHYDVEMEGRQNQYYVFLSNETMLPYNLTANYGVRWTYVETKLSSLDAVYVDGAGMTTPGGLTDWAGNPYDSAGTIGDESNSRAVFNFGLNWRPMASLALRASWSQGFRSPIIQEKFLTVSMGGGTNVGNPDLDPETSNNFEIGARWTDQRLTLDGAIFLSLADDYITTREIATDTYQYVNVGKATTWGVELTGSYDLPAGFTPYASMTFLKRKFEWGGVVGDTYDTDTPAFTFRAGLRWEKDFGDLTLNADAYARGATERDYKQESGGAAVTTHHGGYTTANFSAGVSFGAERQYNITAQVLNIFDKKYYISDALPEAGVHAIVMASAKF